MAVKKSVKDVLAGLKGKPKPKPKAKTKPAAKRRPKAKSRAQAKPADAPKSAGFRFPAGNKFWQVRAKHGRDGIWTQPEALLEDCLSYFEWLDNNPLLEEKGFSYQGVVTHETFAKMRVATLDGLQLHLGISDQCWRNYRERPDFVGVCEYIEKAIKYHKFSGAAADLLNANIIARDLGLRDTVNNEHTGPNGGPIETVTMTGDMDPKAASDIYKRLMGGTR